MDLEHAYLKERLKSALTEKRLIELNKEPETDFNKIRGRNGSRGGGKKWPLWVVQLIL